MRMTELQIDYDDHARPISATCTACGEKMSNFPKDLENPADIITWSFEKFIEHRTLRHSQEDRRRIARE